MKSPAHSAPFVAAVAALVASAQQVYFTGREGYSGWGRFCQFRWFAGLRLRPTETLSLSAAWQVRRIEATPDEWHSIRVVGLSANVIF